MSQEQIDVPNKEQNPVIKELVEKLMILYPIDDKKTLTAVIETIVNKYM